MNDPILKAGIAVLNGSALVAISVDEWDRLKRIEHAAKRLIYDTSTADGEHVTATKIKLQELTLDLRFALG